MPQSVCAIATTVHAAQALSPFCLGTQTPLWLPKTLEATCSREGLILNFYAGALKPVVADLWSQFDALVFGLATGAVVRLIAPLLADKASDPAVVVVDAGGQFAISLCGGHQGGGDRLTQQISHYLRATPVLTGGANYLNLPGIDVLGEPFGWQRGGGDWTGVSAAITRQQSVQVIQAAGSPLWQQHLPADHPFQFGWPEHTADRQEQRPAPQARIWISPIQRQFSPDSNLPKVQWHPRVLWVGVGCERGSSKALIQAAIEQACRQNHLALGAIAGIASLDLKADEPGLVELCQEKGWPLRCFSPDQLKSIAVPNPSPVVEQAVGTPSVAEAAALLAAASFSAGEAAPLMPLYETTSLLLQNRSAFHVAQRNTTSSLSSSPLPLLTPKYIHRQPTESGAVTVAIAQAELEYTGRTGQLWLVGTGPGSLDQITPAAKAAINRADAVIGYGLYIDLIRPLFRPGQIIEALPITQERQRAERAIALANWGLSVAVVSSGDCGIYGMAGLVMEMLAEAGWDGKTPSLEVLPGISALQAAASRVGAPLMHDFCAISLSDLLTPWEVIQQRLSAVAQADFVIALYNPKSKTRTEQIAIAQAILLQHRAGETPVALVRSAYRTDECVVLTTLEEVLNHPIDMLTTVLIGNRSTRLHNRWIITPRGYEVR